MGQVETLPVMLRRLRGERAIREVARDTNVAHSTISRWESGATLPSLPALRKHLIAIGAGIREGMAAEALWYDAHGSRGAA